MSYASRVCPQAHYHARYAIIGCVWTSLWVRVVIRVRVAVASDVWTSLWVGPSIYNKFFEHFFASGTKSDNKKYH